MGRGTFLKQRMRTQVGSYFVPRPIFFVIFFEFFFCVHFLLFFFSFGGALERFWRGFGRLKPPKIFKSIFLSFLGYAFAGIDFSQISFDF